MMNLLKYVLQIVLIVICFSCTEEKQKEVKASETEKRFIAVPITSEQLQMMDIKMEKLEGKLIYPFIYSNGVIKPKPNHEASVTARIAGMIDKIFILEGNSVSKGQALFSISSPELIQLQQDYMEAYINMQLFKKEYDRQTELRKNNIGAVADYQIAENKYLSAVASQKTLEQKLKILGLNPENLQNPADAKIVSEKIITSPLDGFVYKLNAKIGMSIEPTSVLAEIIDLSELHANIYCYEKDLALVDENQSIEIKFINKNIPPATGNIFRISRTVDADTRSIILHCVFKAPKGYLIMPEMAVTAIIKGINSGKVAKTVPLTSIYEETEQNYVFYTAANDTGKTLKFYKAKVKLGANDGKNVEILFEQAVPHQIKIAQTNVTNLQGEFAKYENAN